MILNKMDCFVFQNIRFSLDIRKFRSLDAEFYIENEYRILFGKFCVWSRSNRDFRNEKCW
jgi:hypothetical protein